MYIDDVERSNLVADIDDELVRAERSGDQQAPAAGNPATDGRPAPGDVSDGQATGQTATVDDVTPPVQLRLSSDGDAARSCVDDSVRHRDAAGTRRRSGTFTVEDARYRVLVTPADDGTVRVTALSLERFDESIDDFRRTLLVGGLVVLLLVAGVIWLLTTLAVRPVTRMARTATRIADGDCRSMSMIRAGHARRPTSPTRSTSCSSGSGPRSTTANSPR